MKTEIVNKMTRSFHKVGFQLKKHSPEILIVAGVVGVVTSAVMACKATTKLDDVLETAKQDIDTIHKCVERGTVGVDGPEYTVEDSKKHLATVYAKTGLELVKLYGPSVALGSVSLASIIYSHKILRTRNIALAAAYATVDKSFKDYRGRVVERFGKDLDRELRYNLRAKEIEVLEKDENGEEKVVKKTVEVADINTPNDYARFFDEYCTGWTKSPELNLVFLKQQEQWANRRLQEEGYLYLNEVYESLGIPRTHAGQLIGWVYDPSNADLNNYVDFGIYDLHDEKKRDFVNGYERSILLDFNPDGNVYELMR